MSPLQRSDFHTRESRRNILQNEFGFYCQCNLCSEPNVLDLKQNDLDRRNLLDIEQKWIHLGQDPFKVIIWILYFFIFVVNFEKGFQEKRSYNNGILLPKLFWPTVRKNCSSDLKKLLKFETEGREFAKNLRSLRQFIQTVKGQNNFW